MEDANVPPSTWKRYTRLIRRNFVSTAFPLVVVTSIYWDLSRTKRFKEERAKQALTSDLEKSTSGEFSEIE